MGTGVWGGTRVPQGTEREVQDLPTEQARWGLIYTGVVSHEADRQLTVIGHAHGAQLIAP